MLLVTKLATLVGLVVSSASWVAYDRGSTSNYEIRLHEQGNQAAILEMVKPGEHNTHQMPFNICLNGCSFLHQVSLMH